MPDMMAIVSKAQFEKSAPKAKLGAVLGMRIYRSANKQLERLNGRSRLFLVTVRPPSETLWLVGVLESPQFDDEVWTAKRNRFPVTDISSATSQLKFESGKGIQAKKGALGMSLQTPRVLTPADAELLLTLARSAAATRVRAPGPVNLSAHEPKSPLPCLCARCLPSAPETQEKEGTSYFRASAQAKGRILWFWVPRELESDLETVVHSVQAVLEGRLKPYPDPTPKKLS